MTGSNRNGAWAPARLSDVTRVVRGRVKPQEHPELPYIGMDNVEAHSMRFLGTVPSRAMKSASVLFQPGDVLYGRLRPYLNKVIAAEFEGLASAEFIPLTMPEGVAPKFIQYRLNASDFVSYASHLDEGDRPRVDYDQIGAFALDLPPPEEQHRIVEAIESYFTRLDDAVATLERVQRNLTRYRASVLKAAVEGRLVPTEAELARAEGRDYEHASVLLERILIERRRRWEEAELAKMTAEGQTPKNDKWKAKYKEPVVPDASRLGELPDGWCWATWSQIGVSQNGRAFPSKQYCDEGIRLLRPGNLHVSGRVEWNSKNTRSMPKEWESDYPDYVVKPHELVMNLTAQSLKDQFLGRICITAGAEHCLLNQRIARLTPIFVQPRFILWWFKAPLFRRFVDGLNTGSLIQHMFTSQLAEFEMPLPPIAEQNRIVAEVERQLAIADVIEEDLEQNETRVQRLRQSILRWAFEGKLVDQDPTDEPATELLDRIKAERETAALTKTEKRGRRKARSA